MYNYVGNLTNSINEHNISIKNYLKIGLFKFNYVWKIFLYKHEGVFIVQLVSFF